MKVEAITPNPGGTLPPDQVLGRDADIARYWEILQGRSLALLAPRRMGKTSVCRRMVAQPAPGMQAWFRDLEGLDRSPGGLVRALYQDVHPLLSRSTQGWRATQAFLRALGKAVDTSWVHLDLGPEDWRPLLDSVLTDLQEWATRGDTRVVLVWDEFTLFLYDQARSGPAGAREAMHLLDQLRAARQRHDRLRMVYTGSIGLDEVLRILRRLGHANDPVNDMAREVLPMLGGEAAAELSTRLLASFIREAAIRADLAPHLAALSEGHPYLLQHVAERLRVGLHRTRKAADDALALLLEGATDPLDLSHFMERLEFYFEEEERALALKVLDAVAGAGRGAALDLEELGQRTGEPDRESLLAVLQVLRRGLYLERADGHWSFQLDFLRRYWMLERGL